MSFPAACGSSCASLTSAPRSQGYWRWLRPVAWAREGPAGAETIGRFSGGVAAGASASSARDLDLDGHGLGRRDLDLDRGAVRDPLTERGRGRVEVRDHPAGLLRGGPGGGSRRLGLLAGTALELELVREAGRTAVELGDAVEQPALLARRPAGSGARRARSDRPRARRARRRGPRAGRRGRPGRPRAPTPSRPAARRRGRRGSAPASTSARSASSCSRTSASAARSAARSSRSAARADWSACRAARSRASSSSRLRR